MRSGVTDGKSGRKSQILGSRVLWMSSGEEKVQLMSNDFGS